MLDDLTACRLSRDAYRLAEGLPDEAPDPDDPERLEPDVRERVEDATRRDAVAEALRAAADAAAGSAGESRRAAARALLDAALRRGLTEIAREAKRAWAALGPPPSGFAAAAAAAARAGDPEAARRATEAWRRWCDRREEFDAALREEADALARTWGARDRRAAAAALRPVPAAPWADALERGFVAPLDDALPAGREAARGPAPAGPGSRAARRLAALWGAEAGVDTAAAPPPDGTPAGLALGRPGARALRLVPGDDEAAARAALAATGGWIRGSFLCDLGRAPGALWGDPAFDAAARRLFGRLALNPAFRAEVGLPDAPAALAAALLAEALEARAVWAGLRLVDLRAAPPGAAEVDEVFRRAQGVPPDPLQRDALARSDAARPADRAAELRGWCLAVLLEEQMQRRSGRRWYADARARDRLRAVWDGEAGETAESMAIALDAGTIEPTPLFDACRPPGA